MLIDTTVGHESGLLIKRNLSGNSDSASSYIFIFNPGHQALVQV